ncbi:heterogeneous nuclear ribonucleoprotein K-like isoform X4 [Amphiura filiformis]|uniref:heterogeneous nuclear ribonucleoprotein K-like isoform X4 n=1 Tax=Amphiura filiformis TaxID=82378 RepID=UPI003B21B6E4
MSIEAKLQYMADSGEGSKRSAEEDGGSHMNKRARGGEGVHTTLRVLIYSKNAGAIIGKGGNTIKGLRSKHTNNSRGPGRCDQLLDGYSPNLGRV